MNQLPQILRQNSPFRPLKKIGGIFSINTNPILLQQFYTPRSTRTSSTNRPQPFLRIRQRTSHSMNRHLHNVLQRQENIEELSIKEKSYTMSNIYIRRKHSFVEEASNFESVRSHLAGELCETGKVSDSIKSDLVGIRESFCKMEENITKQLEQIQQIFRAQIMKLGKSCKIGRAESTMDMRSNQQHTTNLQHELQNIIKGTQILNQKQQQLQKHFGI